MKPLEFFKIDRYTNYFVVSKYNPLSEKILKDFCRQYIQYGLMRVGMRWQKTPLKVFAAHCAPEREYRFHKNQWMEFIRQCGNYGIPISKIEIKDHSAKRGVFCDLKDESGKVPRDYQLPILDYLANMKVPTAKLVGIQTGKGKGQPASSLIKVLGGWTTMGSVKVGDYVTGRDGCQKKVLGKYPQGVKDVYKITFSDGRSTLCDNAHLWEVYCDYGDDTTRWSVINTTDIVQLISLKTPKVCIRLCESEDVIDDNNLPMLPHDYGFLTYNFSISLRYLNASTNQRKALLQGLMDTGGLVCKDGVTYTTSNEQLAKDVQYLVRSLGGIATVKSTPNSLEFTVDIQVKEPESLFRDVAKKAALFKKKIYPTDLKLQIQSVVKVDSQETFCISVDSPDHLYITDEFIVTHNTFIAAKAICNEGRRFAVVLKAKYMEKWVSDVLELTDCTKSDVLVIRGSNSLMAAINAGKEGTLEYKAIIISNRTLQNYITLYEEKGDKILELGYDCLPQDFFETLGVDTRLIDEVHEDFHFNFKLDLYTNVHRCISLSATLLSEDSFLANMYELAYPVDERFDEMEYDKYIHSHSYQYQIENADNINTIGTGTGMYSHHLLEQSILRNKVLRLDFFEMIRGLYEEYFRVNFKSGERCLIYCASIDMCTALTSWLQTKYPNVDIRRYVENDPYENLMDSRTCVSTLQSAGTGHDIKGLVFVLLTVAVSSSKSNIQGFGRLRKIEGKDLHFIYLVCTNMQKHVQYHEQKKQLLMTRSLVHSDIVSNKTLGR